MASKNTSTAAGASLMLFGVSTERRNPIFSSCLFISSTWCRLLGNRLYVLPLAAEVLLPQRDLVVGTANGQDVAAERPADAPHRRLKFKDLIVPLGRSSGRRIAGPDAHCLVLRRRRNVGLLEDSRRPSNITDPVRVSCQSFALLLVRLRRGVERPDLENVVAAAGDEAAVAH